MKTENTSGPRPRSSLDGLDAYQTPPFACPIDLRLDGNEGPAPSPSLLTQFSQSGIDSVNQYPTPVVLETILANKLGLEADQVLVTAGADDALDRICRAYLGPRREIIVPTPTFEMILRYSQLCEARVNKVDWLQGDFPTQQILDRVNQDTAAIAVVSPNNPTGLVASQKDLKTIAQQAPQALIIVDLAYAEFADQDLMEIALTLPNTVVVRSLSKAWGLAGLRVGYALAAPSIIRVLRAAGGPYAVSGPSLMMARQRLQQDTKQISGYISRVRQERSQLIKLLQGLGARVLPSQGNFVLTKVPHPNWLRDCLAGLGIAVRVFSSQDLSGWVRISCPGDKQKFDRLQQGIASALNPQALLFDMDGVLADVSASYRQAIIRTAESFGVTVTAQEVSGAKFEADANNDWKVTQQLLGQKGVDADLKSVIECFERHYQTLCENEKLIPTRDLLRRLAAKKPLGIVTGRPHKQALAFLTQSGIGEFFSALVCMEDAPAKPSPQPLRLACSLLSKGSQPIERAWFVGDTPDDIRAARQAGIVPIGFSQNPHDTQNRDKLARAGCGRILQDLAELEENLL